MIETRSLKSEKYLFHAFFNIIQIHIYYDIGLLTNCGYKFGSPCAVKRLNLNLESYFQIKE